MDLKKNIHITKFIETLKKEEGFIDIKGKNLKRKLELFKTGYAISIDNIIYNNAPRDCSLLHFSPQILIRPKKIYQLKAIVKTATLNRIPLTFAGGKTGLSGGYINPYCVLDLEILKTLDKPIKVNIKNNKKKTVKVDQRILVSNLINLIQKLSNNEYIFPVQPSSSFKLPVRIGGLISTNASGVTSGKLGPISDWIESIEIMTPKGVCITINSSNPLFRKVVGGMGNYGIVLNAVIKLAKNPQNIDYRLLFGSELEGAFKGLQNIQDKMIFPLSSEFVLTSSSLPGLFGELFQSKPVKWAIVLRGKKETIDKFEREIKKTTKIYRKDLNQKNYQVYLEERTALAVQTHSTVKNDDFIQYPGFEDQLLQPIDAVEIYSEINKILKQNDFPKAMVGYGHINFRKGEGILLHLRIPVSIADFTSDKRKTCKRIAKTVAQMNYYLISNYKIKPKSEHSPGMLLPWIRRNDLDPWREDINKEVAFINPHLIFFDSIVKELKIKKQLNIEFTQQESIEILEQMYFEYLYNPLK